MLSPCSPWAGPPRPRRCRRCPDRHHAAGRLSDVGLRRPPRRSEPGRPRSPSGPGPGAGRRQGTPRPGQPRPGPGADPALDRRHPRASRPPASSTSSWSPRTRTTAPSSSWTAGPIPRPPTCRRLEEKIAEVILTANQALRPARLGVASKEVALNRNRHSKRADRPVDRELLVLRVEDTDGKPIAHAVNFAAHATLLDSKLRRFSADYPGVLAALIEKDTAAPCLFLQGAAGDLSADQGTAAGPEKFGQALGREVLALIKTIRCSALEKPALRVREEDFRFKPRIELDNPVVQGLASAAFFRDLVLFYEREYREGVRPHLTRGAARWPNRLRRRFGRVLLRPFPEPEAAGPAGAPVLPGLLQRLSAVFPHDRGGFRGRLRHRSAGFAGRIRRRRAHHGPRPDSSLPDARQAACAAAGSVTASHARSSTVHFRVAATRQRSATVALRWRVAATRTPIYGLGSYLAGSGMLSAQVDESLDSFCFDGRADHRAG